VPLSVPGRRPRWQRKILRHRRVLAAVFTGIAVFATVSALRPPPSPTVTAWVAAHDLTPGNALGANDIVTAAIPAAVVVTDAIADPQEVLGRTITYPLRAGEQITARALLSTSFLSSLGADVRATPVHLGDDSAAALVQRGDLVDIISATSSDSAALGGTSSATVVASRVRVLITPPSSSSASGGLGTSLSGSSGIGGSNVIVLATTPAQALDLMRASVAGRLSAVLVAPAH